MIVGFLIPKILPNRALPVQCDCETEGLKQFEGKDRCGHGSMWGARQSYFKAMRWQWDQYADPLPLFLFLRLRCDGMLESL